MNKMRVLITSVILAGTIGVSFVFASGITGTSQTASEPLPETYNTEHQTGKYWMDGSPIYEKYFAFKIYEDSWAWLDKELQIDEIFDEDLNYISVIGADAQGAFHSVYPEPESGMLNTCHVDTIRLSYDGHRFIILEDVWHPGTKYITIWGAVTYIKKGEMPDSIFTPYLGGHVSDDD